MVILLKNKSIPRDKYEEKFLEVGDIPYFIPLLNHVPVDPDQLLEFLHSKEMKTADSLIFTSQRAVEAVWIHLKRLNSDQLGLILSKPTYTVGPTTASALKQCGFIDVRGEESGNGQKLSEFIIDESAKDRDMTYVFFTGEITRGVIQSAIRNTKNLHLIEKVVYRTSEIGLTDYPFMSAFNKHDSKPIWIVFFSPSNTSRILSELRQMPRNSFLIAAIGPTTEDYLKEKGFDPEVTASQPTAEHLLKGMREYEKTI